MPIRPETALKLSRAILGPEASETEVKLGASLAINYVELDEQQTELKSTVLDFFNDSQIGERR